MQTGASDRTLAVASNREERNTGLDAAVQKTMDAALAQLDRGTWPPARPQCHHQPDHPDIPFGTTMERAPAETRTDPAA